MIGISGLRGGLDSTDKLPSLTGKTVSGGRLNIQKALGGELRGSVKLTAQALEFTFAGTPNQLHAIEASTDLKSWVPVAEALAAADGTIALTQPAFGYQPVQFYRVVALRGKLLCDRRHCRLKVSVRDLVNNSRRFVFDFKFTQP